MPKDAHTGPDQAARGDVAGADSEDAASAQDASGESAAAPSSRLTTMLKRVAAPALVGAAAGLAIGIPIGLGTESTTPADVEKAGARVKAEVSAQLEAFRGEVLDILDKRLREAVARAEDAAALGDAERAAIRLAFRAELGKMSVQLAALADRLADAADRADQAAYETALADTLAQVGAIAARLERIEERLTDGASAALAISPRVLREILTEILALRQMAAAHARRLSELGEAAGDAAAPTRKDAPDSAGAAPAEASQTEAGGSADAAQPEGRGEGPGTGAVVVADARGREALEGIGAALDSGEGFGAELEALAALGVEVPQALASAREGVATLSALRSAFPAAARAALAAAWANAPMGGEDGGVEGFLRKQFGVRSLRRREGGGTDAALSRAEDALADGRLAEALAEIESLSAAVRGKMADWAAQARRRLEAVDAAAALGGRLD